MFDELARLRFFIPKQNPKYRYKNDKFPIVVMESVGENKYVVRGKFPDENNAQIFLQQLRALYVIKMKEEMGKVIEQTVAEQNPSNMPPSSSG